MDKNALLSKLQSCLLSDTEMADPAQWELYEDPFPPSDFEDDDHDDDFDGDDSDGADNVIEVDIVASVQ